MYINPITFMIAILAGIATIMGIFTKEGPGQSNFVSVFGQSITLYGRGIYAQNSVTAALQAIPHDMVTLIIGLPLLITSLLLSQKGSVRGRIVLAGTLGYFLITYCMFTFIAMFNRLFIVYVMLMSLSLFGLLMVIFTFDFNRFMEHVKENFPRRFAGISLLVSTSMVALLWLARVLPSLKGVIPQEVEHGTTLAVQAFDLAFFLPGFIISSVLLLKKNRVGYLLTSICTIADTLVMTALLSKGISMVLAGMNDAMPLIIMTSVFAKFISRHYMG